MINSWLNHTGITKKGKTHSLCLWADSPSCAQAAGFGMPWEHWAHGADLYLYFCAWNPRETYGKPILMVGLTAYPVCLRWFIQQESHLEDLPCQLLCRPTDLVLRTAYLLIACICFCWLIFNSPLYPLRITVLTDNPFLILVMVVFPN